MRVGAGGWRVGGICRRCEDGVSLERLAVVKVTSIFGDGDGPVAVVGDDEKDGKESMFVEVDRE